MSCLSIFHLTYAEFELIEIGLKYILPLFSNVGFPGN